MPDGEHEAGGGEQQRRRAAERALEQHRAGDRAARAGVAPRRLVDPRRVAAERGREHLGGGVGDERRPHEPAEPLVTPLEASSFCQRQASGQTERTQIANDASHQPALALAST